MLTGGAMPIRAGDLDNGWTARSGVVGSSAGIPARPPGTVPNVAKWQLLSSLSEDDRRRVLAKATRHRYARKEALFHEGDPGETLHLIDSGRIAIRITTPLGSVATLVVLGPGDVLGELSLVSDGRRRSATAVALEKTQTLALHRNDFEAIVQEHPAVHRFLVTVLAEQVARLSRLLLEALYVPADKRVVRRLVDLSAVYATRDGGPVDIAVTQEDLASLAGTSRATANRVLGELERAGVLSTARGCVSLGEPALLAAHAR